MAANITTTAIRYADIRDVQIRQEALGENTGHNSSERWQYAVNVVLEATALPIKYERGTDGDPNLPYGIAVHVAHCCSRHGCKYSHPQACAVVLGEFAQDYPCEQCEDDPSPEAYILLQHGPLGWEFILGQSKTLEVARERAADISGVVAIYGMVDGLPVLVERVTHG